MAGKNHVHQYVLYKVNRFETKMANGEVLYKCADPRCSHYAPYSAVLGKMSRCGQCGQTEIILTRELLNTYKERSPYVMIPRGECCSNKTKAKEERRIKNILDSVIGSTMEQVG